MFCRPLVPALGVTISGILVGRAFLTDANVPSLLLAALIAISLGITFIIPSKGRTAWLMAVFLLLGISSQVNQNTSHGLKEVLIEAERVVVEGTIYSPPRIRFNSASFRLHGERIFLPGEARDVRIDVLVRVYRHQGTLAVGQRVRLPARFREFKNFNNPGGFDYRSYMQAQGLSFMAIVPDGRYVVPMGRGDLGFVGKTLEKMRRPLRGFFRERLSPTLNPIYTALILGERQNLTPEIRAPFDKSGVGHIMAVSGLHLGFVAWLSYTFLRWAFSFSRRLILMTDIRKLAAIVTIGPVVIYGLITGLQVSSQRAMIMVLVFLGSVIMGKEKDVWSSLSLAALIILTLMGNSLFTASFQLSFTAVAGILWLTPLIFSRMGAMEWRTEGLKGNRVVRVIVTYTVGLIAVTLAATVVTIPLIAHHFHRFSALALAANITVVPIIGLWVLPLGLVSCLALPFSPYLAGSLLSLGASGLNLAVSAVTFWSNIPWSSFWVVRPNWVEVLLLYGLLFLGVSYARSKLCRLLLILTLSLLCMDVGYWIYQTRLNNNLRVTILDAGKADLTVIRFPGKERMLIARNAFGSKGFNLGRMVVAPYFWQEKIKRIDYLFLVDPHVQRTERLAFVTTNFHPREVLSDLPTERMIEGAKIKGGNTEGVILSYGGWAFLFSDREVRIVKLTGEGGKGQLQYLITKDEATRHGSAQVVSICETGALTITVDPNGKLSMKGFLKKNPPLLEGGF
jgi:competence protein ComEC